MVHTMDTADMAERPSRRAKLNPSSPNYHNNLMKLLGTPDLRGMLDKCHATSVDLALVCKGAREQWNGYTPISEIGSRERLEDYVENYNLLLHPGLRKAVMKAAIRLKSIKVCVILSPRVMADAYAREVVKADFVELLTEMKRRGIEPDDEIFMESIKRGNVEMAAHFNALFPNVVRRKDDFDIIQRAPSVDVLDRIFEKTGREHSQEHIDYYLRSTKMDIVLKMEQYYTSEMMERAFEQGTTLKKLEWMKRKFPDMEFTRDHLCEAIRRGFDLQVVRWLTKELSDEFRWTPEMIDDDMWLDSPVEVLRYIIGESGWVARNPGAMFEELMDEYDLITPYYIERLRFFREIGGIEGPPEALEKEIATMFLLPSIKMLLEGNEKYDWEVCMDIVLLGLQGEKETIELVLPKLPKYQIEIIVWLVVLKKNVDTARFLKKRGEEFRMMDLDCIYKMRHSHLCLRFNELYWCEDGVKPLEFKRVEEKMRQWWNNV
jgi:hypothetical protein